MKAAGQDEDAQRVKSLPKPPVSVWIVNRLARAEAREVAALAEAGEQLVTAQEQALGGDRDRFAAARDAHAEALRAAGSRIAPLLQEDGRPSTQATVERATSLLRAASLDAQARPLLVAGRLPDELEASGFSLFASIELPAAAPKRKARDDGLADLKRQLKEARSEARELRRLAAKEARTAERLRGEAERAEQAAAAADDEARRAEAAVDDLEAKVAK